MSIIDCYVDRPVIRNTVGCHRKCFAFTSEFGQAIGYWWGAMWTDWLLFQSCYFPMWFGKKKLSIFKVKKIQGSLLVNEFSEFQIFLPGRVLENHFRRACYGSLIEESALCAYKCRAPSAWILARPSMNKIETYWWMYQELETKPFCAAFSFDKSDFSETWDRTWKSVGHRRASTEA